MNRFSKKAGVELKSYVYALIDPHTEEIFYVGKGSTPGRPFSHLEKNDVDSDKDLQNRISSIRAQRLEPIVDIIRYGLDKNVAHEVESAVIDTIGLKNLTNSIHGHQTERGRIRADTLNQQLSGEPLHVEDINISAILFYGHRAQQKYASLYDATRQFWNLDKNRIKRKEDGKLRYQYAFAMNGSVVLEVYKILEWYLAGATVSSRKFDGDGKERWEFIGAPVEKPLLKKYQNRVLYRDDSIMHAPQGGIRYLD